MINIVIPMAGEGSRFSKQGYDKPKPFIDVAGEPMIARVLENLQIEDANYILLARKSHMDQQPITVSKIKEQFNAKFVTVDRLTEGTACTILLAKNLIDSDAPVLIANSDQFVECDIQNFINEAHDKKLDGSILTFKDRDPKWSFARLGPDGLVQEVREKVAISDNATVGIYYFSDGRKLVRYAEEMISANDRVNNEFYTCPIYNYFIKHGHRIGIHHIEKACMHGLGTPEDLEAFLRLNKL